MAKILITLAFVFLPHSAFGQKSKQPTMGWDLSYRSILEANHIGREEWIWKWLGPNYHSPIQKLVLDWNGEPIESSILIEYPQFHAAEHTTLWFVRTKNHAYHWGLIEDKPPHSVKKPLDPALYDKFFAVVSPWQQAKALKSEDTPIGGVPGFMGFISSYDRGHSQQMLLTLDDFWLCDTKKCEGGKGGRLAQAMKILPPV